MKTLAASLLALGFLAGAAHAASAPIFADINASAPRGVFADLGDTAPRSPFDALQEAAPRSPFDSLQETAPRTARGGYFTHLERTSP